MMQTRQTNQINYQDLDDEQINEQLQQDQGYYNMQTEEDVPDINVDMITAAIKERIYNTKARVDKRLESYDNFQNLEELQGLAEDQKQEIYLYYENAWKTLHEVEKKKNKRKSSKQKIKDYAIMHAYLGPPVSREEFLRIASNWSNKDDDIYTMDEDAYDAYQRAFYEQPGKTILDAHIDDKGDNTKIGFRSKNKIRHIKTIDKSLEEPMDLKPDPIFPVKYNKENFQLHKVGPRGYYLVDLMFEAPRYCYLVCINVNTRYLYVELMNHVTENGRIGTDLRKATNKYLDCLKRMMEDRNFQPKYLSGDAEPAFISKRSKQFYHQYDIQWIPIERMTTGNYLEDFENRVHKNRNAPLHSSLGLIDRVIRTLRDMQYHINEPTLVPALMKNLVYQYNMAPHSTLSHYACFSCSPDMVHHTNDLEEFIVRKICQENYNTFKRRGFDIPLNTIVKIYNEYTNMEKKRSHVEPDFYEVLGFYNGLYKVMNQRTGQTKNVPRFRICVVDTNKEFEDTNKEVRLPKDVNMKYNKPIDPNEIMMKEEKKREKLSKLRPPKIRRNDPRYYNANNVETYENYENYENNENNENYENNIVEGEGLDSIVTY